jgi:hypothetical protein
LSKPTGGGWYLSNSQRSNQLLSIFSPKNTVAESSNNQRKSEKLKLEDIGVLMLNGGFQRQIELGFKLPI